MTYIPSSVDRDIDREEKKRGYFQRKQKYRAMLGTCDSCGKPIFGRDRTGEPYRQCYICMTRGR